MFWCLQTLLQNTCESTLDFVMNSFKAFNPWVQLFVVVLCRCFCAVAFGGKLYVFGGESEKVNKKVLRGKTELSKSALWSVAHEKSKPPAYLSPISHPSVLVLSHSYDPRDDKWTVLAEMSVARALAGCTVFKNKIYVIGRPLSLNNIFESCYEVICVNQIFATFL